MKIMPSSPSTIPAPRVRLAQLLLFGTGLGLNDFLSDDIPVNIEIHQIGPNNLTQSDWMTYLAMLHFASNSANADDDLISVRIEDILNRIGKIKGTGTIKAITKSLNNMQLTYLKIRKDDYKFNEALFDFLYISKGNITYKINANALQFWRAGLWSDQELSDRLAIGNADLTLWLYSLAKTGITTIKIPTLKRICKTNAKTNNDFNSRLTSAIKSLHKINIYYKIIKDSSNTHHIVLTPPPK